MNTYTIVNSEMKNRPITTYQFIFLQKNCPSKQLQFARMHIIKEKIR